MVDRFVGTFNLNTLTLIHYEDWRGLPEKPAIYFVFDALSEILYIGQTEHLMRRWSSNYRSFYNYGPASIGFLLIDQPLKWRLCLERTLIKKFRPSLHGVQKVPGPKLGCKRGERKLLREAAKRRYGFI